MLLGLLFLAVYFLIRSYTSTVSYFETVPSFVPATLVSKILFLIALAMVLLCKAHVSSVNFMSTSLSSPCTEFVGVNEALVHCFAIIMSLIPNGRGGFR